MVSEIAIEIAQNLFGWFGLSGVGAVYFMAIFFSAVGGIWVASRTENSISFIAGFCGGLIIFTFLGWFEWWIVILAIIIGGFILYKTQKGGSWSI